MALDLRTRDAAAGRAHLPVGPVPSVPTYQLTEPRVLRAVELPRKTRAIRLSDDTKNVMMLTGMMQPFLGLMVAEFLAVPLWASIPGTAVIIASMFITVIVFASHPATPSRHPGKKR